MEYKLEYYVNEEPQVFYLNKKTVTIGKLPDNDIELKDNTVSRQHCKLERHGDGFRLVDLKSTNGCYVNGKKFQEKSLSVGDRITVGRTQLQFKLLAPSESYIDNSDQRISIVKPLAELVHSEEQPQRMAEAADFLPALTKLGQSLIACQEMNESFDKISRLICDFVHPEKVLIFSYDEKQNDLHLKHTWSHKPDEVANISKSIALKAIHEKVAILSSNTRDDARFDSSKSIIIYGISSAISVPIWTKECIYGLIYIDTTSFARVFNERDLEMMSLIANFAGFSVEGVLNLEKLGRERKFRSRLERYHSPAVVSRLMQSPDDNADEIMTYREAEATVLFLDIVKFTTRAEKMTPTEVGIFLNNFFSEMTEIIFTYNGTLDKFIGDAIMAIFGVPIALENHAEMAIRAALDMMKKLIQINRQLPEKERIKVRIGINAGKLISGDFGSPKRLDYTVLGNSVNIASRLESIAGPNEILVSESIHQATADKFAFEGLGEKKLQNISTPVKVYRVIQERGES
jgi:adenylate cyclase